jgi:hypothetical protein
MADEHGKAIACRLILQRDCVVCRAACNDGSEGSAEISEKRILTVYID